MSCLFVNGLDSGSVLFVHGFGKNCGLFTQCDLFLFSSSLHLRSSHKKATIYPTPVFCFPTRYTLEGSPLTCLRNICTIPVGVRSKPFPQGPPRYILQSRRGGGHSYVFIWKICDRQPHDSVESSLVFVLICD